MLVCERLKLQQGRFVLEADIGFRAGAITALIGPSGAGKSTLLSALAGFLTPQSGLIKNDGIDLTPIPPGKRPISILFQDNNLFPHLTIFQNVGLGLQPKLRLSPDEAERVTITLENVGLAGLGGRRPAELSGGQQSRAALARVLLADRPIILLDEPFAALGPGLKTEMLDLVRDTLAVDDKTVIMVTHDPADAKHVASETVFVADGVALPPVPTAHILKSPSPALAAYLGQVGQR